MVAWHGLTAVYFSCVSEGMRIECSRIKTKHLEICYSFCILFYSNFELFGEHGIFELFPFYSQSFNRKQRHRMPRRCAAAILFLEMHLTCKFQRHRPRSIENVWALARRSRTTETSAKMVA